MKIFRIIYEGDPSLKRSFSSLLNPDGLDNIQIEWGPNLQDAVKKFKGYQGRADTIPVLLIDLDGQERQARAKALSIIGLDNIYFMVQTMESWFLSQHQGFTPPPEAFEIRNPTSALKHLRNGKYGKASDGPVLLQMLDRHKLAQTFPDFQRLLEVLPK